MKIKKIWLMLLSILTTSTLLVGCKVNHDQVKPQQSQTVVIGIDDSFVPMGYREKNGTLTGYDIDLAKALFRKKGIKVDFQTIDWDMKETELRNHTIDLIWNGYTKNPEREKKVAFSHNYLINNQVLVTLKKSNISRFSDMKNKQLGVQTGSSGQESFNQTPKVLKNYIYHRTPVLYSSFNQAFIDLKVDRIQGLLIDSVYADYYVAHQARPADYQIIKGNFPPEYFAVGMRKNDFKLKKTVNSGLKELYQDGTMDKLATKWFGTTKDVVKQ